MSIMPKRGRKPKNKVSINTTLTNKENPIITHLPINIDNDDDIFIKNIDSKDIQIKKLKEKVNQLMNELDNSIINDELYNISSNDLENDNINCWWCRHSYTTPTVCLPEYYFKEQFYTFGNFCSYNCALSYNINLNDDNIFKRSSLLYYFYKKTYNITLKIVQSPSWKVLKKYGGVLSISEFRKNFVSNDYEYNYIKPPMISRIYQIEKILTKPTKKAKNEYVLKRSKPLNNSKYSLEHTMGLKKTINLSET
uniref:MYM-type domain-containing protein n=1 Tax=viral metagenome TaxID=1070528 RepID=A0A6C0J8Z8_9ZZZZ